MSDRLPNSFLPAIDAWRATRQASRDAIARLGQHLSSLVDTNTNLYLIHFNSEAPDRFGFETLVGNVDIRVRLDKSVLSDHPDRRHVDRDLLPHYHHVSKTGELRQDSIRGSILGHFAHYDRVILPISAAIDKAPTHAISLSKVRFIIDPGEGDTKTLSDREHQVFSLVASGLTTKEIARELNSSPRTVETQLNAIKTKTGAKNIAHAVALHLLRSTF